jgi:hypothetical protein
MKATTEEFKRNHPGISFQWWHRVHNNTSLPRNLNEILSTGSNIYNMVSIGGYIGCIEITLTSS